MQLVIKRNVTLIEMLIVMFLIALILGVVAYNYQGTLEEGKAFKSKTGKEKVETILTLAISQNPELEEDIESTWKDVIRKSPLVKNPNDLIKDGWGVEYEVHVQNGKVTVRSQKLEEYMRSK